MDNRPTEQKRLSKLKTRVPHPQGLSAASCFHGTDKDDPCGEKKRTENVAMTTDGASAVCQLLHRVPSKPALTEISQQSCKMPPVTSDLKIRKLRFKEVKSIAEKSQNCLTANPCVFCNHSTSA